MVHLRHGLRLVLLSDPQDKHGELAVPPGDILLHAGDISCVGRLGGIQACNDFLGRLPHRHKIVVCGNHDWCFPHHPAEA